MTKTTNKKSQLKTPAAEPQRANIYLERLPTGLLIEITQSDGKKAGMLLNHNTAQLMRTNLDHMGVAPISFYGDVVA